MTDQISFSYSRICDLSEEKKGEIISLWHSAFGDSREYICFMLEDVLSDGRVFMAHTGQMLCSMCVSLDISYIYEEKSAKATYFYAATTKEDFRGRGIFEKLITYAESTLEKGGTQMCFLVPASGTLVNYYRRLGYKNVTFCSKTVIKADNKGYNFEKTNITDSLYDIYLNSENKYSRSLTKSKKLFFGALRSAIFDGDAELFVTDRAFVLTKLCKGKRHILIISENHNEQDIASSVLAYLGEKKGLLARYSDSGEIYCMAKSKYVELTEYIHTSLMFE